MFARFFQTPRPGTIGCSLHDNGLRMVQARQSRKATGPLVTHHSSHALIDPRDIAAWKPLLTEALGEALQTGRFTGRDIVISLPTSLMGYRRLRMASMPGAEMAAAVRWRAAKELGAGVGELQAGFYMVSGSSADTKHDQSCREVIAVTSQIQHINQCVEVFTSAGLNVLAVDAPAGALMRALSHHARQDSPCMVIEVGLTSSAVMVMRQGQPCYIRTIPSGKSQIIQRAASRLGLGSTGHAELWDILDRGQAGHPCEATPHQTLAQVATLHAGELAHESRLCAHYMANLEAGAHLPARGCIIGAGAHEGLYIDILTQACDVPFAPLQELLDPAICDALADVDGDTPVDAWLTALGLSQHPGLVRPGEVA